IAEGLQAVGVEAALSETLGRAVYAQVAGHPYLTQRMGELLAGSHAAGTTLSPADVAYAAREIVTDAPPLLRRIRDDLRTHQLEEAARRLLRDRPPFDRLDDDMVRLELIGLAKRDGAHWAPRNPLLAKVFRKQLGMSEPDSAVSSLADQQPTDELEESAAMRTHGIDASSFAPSTNPVLPTPNAESNRVAAEPKDAGLHNQQMSGVPNRIGTNISASTIFRMLILIVPVIAIAAWAGFSGSLFQPPEPTPQPAWVPTLVEIPAGSFLMGSSDVDPLANDNEKPQHILNLPDYWIGKTEVTNAQFRPFVEGDGYTNRAYWTETGWAWRQENNITRPAYWDDPTWNGDEQPVTGISWFEAVAYVRWLSEQTGHEFRLPTEAEWEKAARGTDGRIWPWGNTWDGAKLNSNGIVGQTTPVGQYPDGTSPYGILDMAGNVWEWCATQYGKHYPYQQKDEWKEAYIEGNAVRVLRGGSWLHDQKFVRASYRNYY
ncbi:MAG: hypothetical protein EOM24_26010, partial [Chloroflexia bacterium]|nr:hypothetical protein [Chloroflexia bacterium]